VNSPLEAEGYRVEVGFMVKKYFLCSLFLYVKRKDTRNEDELGSKKMQQPFPGNSARNACWYFLTHIEIIRKRTELPL
jgi:hypothetical protein